MVLFGNIEVREIVFMERMDFERRVIGALKDGTRGPGRGFVLMPSASPVGFELPVRAARNYECMVRIAEHF